MQNLTELVQSQTLVASIVVSVGLLLKYLLVKFVRRRAASKGEDRRDVINNVKNVVNFVMVILLLSLWSNEIQKFAFSIAAFSVAIVLATREFIQCIIGFFYLMSTRPFRIGDWIEVENFVGEVSATDWIKSTLLEVDITTYQYTGKTLFIPNNKLISSPIKNLNFLKRYATHKFSIVRDQSVNPYLFIETVIDNAKQYSKDFYEVATRYNQMLERRLDVPIAGPDPQFKISTTELGDTQIEITLFCPTELAIEMEQVIVKDFMQHWYANRPLCVNEED